MKTLQNLLATAMILATAVPAGAVTLQQQIQAMVNYVVNGSTGNSSGVHVVHQNVSIAKGTVATARAARDQLKREGYTNAKITSVRNPKTGTITRLVTGSKTSLASGGYSNGGNTFTTRDGSVMVYESSGWTPKQ